MSDYRHTINDGMTWARFNEWINSICKDDGKEISILLVGIECIVAIGDDIVGSGAFPSDAVDNAIRDWESDKQ